MSYSVKRVFVSMETCTDTADVGDIFTQDSKAEDLGPVVQN